jgi:hypothetical protein
VKSYDGWEPLRDDDSKWLLGKGGQGVGDSEGSHLNAWKYHETVAGDTLYKSWRSRINSVKRFMWPSHACYLFWESIHVNH